MTDSNFCVTYGLIDEVKVSLSSTFRWTIYNYDDIYLSVGSCLLSPVFTMDDSNVQWRLKLYPKSKTEIDKDFISVSVYYYSKIGTMASYELSLMDHENQVLEQFKVKKDLELVSDTESESGGWIAYRAHPRFVDRAFIMNPENDVILDGCLAISFEVSLQNPMILNTKLKRDDRQLLTDLRLLEFDDFEELLSDDQFSDVTFIIGDKKVRGHKAVLAVRSPIFRAMFESKPGDSMHTTILEINDVGYPVFKQFLRFIYTGRVNGIHRVAKDLLVVSKKYQVEGLEILCEKILYNLLKIDNALELLILADDNDTRALKKRVLGFIAENANQIVESDQFALLRPDLVHEIVRAMARHRTYEDQLARSSGFPLRR